MKKKIISLILCLVLVLSASSVTFAEELGAQEENSISVLRVEPCPYWANGQHKYVTGATTYPHYQQYTHTHFIYDDLGGIIGSYDDWYCNVYKSVDTYCACGRHSSTNYFSYSHCH